MKKIIYKHKNNEVAIVNIIDDSVVLETVIDRVVPAGCEWAIIDEFEVPSDRTFRDAWIFNNNTIAVDIPKAKEIQKNKWRAARKPILERLDVEYMRALEVGDTQKQQEIAAKKQELRDITEISLPDDLEGIKKIWPSVLNS